MTKILLENDYWKIEFNERMGGEKSYNGEIVTKEILDEIRSLDEQWYLANRMNDIGEYAKHLGYNIHDSRIKNIEGYAKFYFEHIQDDKVVETLRIDVGDGNEVNRQYFDHIQSQLHEKEIETAAPQTNNRKENKMKENNNIVFLPITAKQVVKRNVENVTKQGEKYFQHKILIGHGKHKGKSMWIHTNHLIEKEKINKTTLESFISCAVLLNLDKPIKLYEHGINPETGKIELKSTTIISNIREFVNEILLEKQKNLQEKMKSHEEKTEHVHEQEEEIEH